MAVQFTKEQQRVIDVRGKNVLVSAAAGSGKTAVLVERILSLICDEKRPVNIDELLVVTFTNAAAAQMRERIGSAIAARLQREPGSEHLQRQTVLLHHAQITTIDSFCMYVLRNHFNDIGLDPGFRVADEGEVRLLKQEVLSALLEEKFAEGAEEFLYLADCYGGGRGSQLEEIILKLHACSESLPWPEDWLRERREDYRIFSLQELEGKDWVQAWLVHMRRVFACLSQDIRRALQLCGEIDGPAFYGPLLEEEALQLERIAGARTLPELEAAMAALGFGRLPGKRDPAVDPEKREQVKALRDAVKKQAGKLRETYLGRPFSELPEQMRFCSRYVETLADLTLEFSARMAARKREKNVIDFSDMEHLALRVLVERHADGTVSPTAAALEYRRFYQEILIDEYQDSNLVQEYLLTSICGEAEGRHDLFMVGDVKQSIYKFRLARPEIFMEKQEDYAGAGEEDGKELILLNRNFRSRAKVLESVNRIFARLMRKELGGVEYEESVYLYPGADYPEQGADYGTELLLAVGEDAEADGGESGCGGAEGLPASRKRRTDFKELEARAVAVRIRELVGHFPVWDAGQQTFRPAAYRDIVILLRSPAGWDETFKRVLQDAGVPVYLTARTGYFAAPEIQNVLQFLQILDNPLQDIPFYAVLHSCFGGFTEEETALLKGREGNRKKKLYTCIRERAAQGMAAQTRAAQDMAAPEGAETAGGGGDRLTEKCRRFLSLYDSLRQQVVYLPIHKLLRELFDRTGYPEQVAAMPAGEQRLANVKMLLQRAEAFTRTSYFGLFHFLRYMEQVEKYDVDFGEANILDENADTVRLMSIHKSKGLEFPICFVCGLSKKFNRQDGRQAVPVDMDAGLGVDEIDPIRRTRTDTFRKRVLTGKMWLDSLGEELRVLYVAMTRAKEKLILTGFREEPPAAAEPAVLPYTRLSGADCFLELLLYAGGDVLQLRTFGKKELTLAALGRQAGQEVRRLELEKGVQEAEKEEVNWLRERFSFRYPHENLQRLFAKTTVSELKKAGMQEEEDVSFHLVEEERIEPYLPRFLRKEEPVTGASGSDRGTAYHKVMELWDFTGGLETGASLQKLQEEGRLPTSWAALVRPEKIAAFLRTSLAERMKKAAAAGGLRREQPFVLGVSASELDREFPPEETVLIQGIIDVWFEEDGGIVLADYKTDAVREEGQLAGRYRVQLDWYARALERITGKRVKEKLLYSFALEKEIRV